MPCGRQLFPHAAGISLPTHQQQLWHMIASCMCLRVLLMQMETPQARVGWSGSMVRLRPSTAGTAMFTAKTSGCLQQAQQSYVLDRGGRSNITGCQLPPSHPSRLSAATAHLALLDSRIQCLAASTDQHSGSSTNGTPAAHPGDADQRCPCMIPQAAMTSAAGVCGRSYRIPTPIPSARPFWVLPRPPPTQMTPTR
jgi:hypothetical protein